MAYAKLLTDTITYWAPGTPDGFGTKAFASPVHLKARYQNSNLELVDQAGQKFVSVAIVYTERALAFGGFVAYGTYNESPQTVPSAYRVARTGDSHNPQKKIAVYRTDLG